MEPEHIIKHFDSLDKIQKEKQKIVDSIHDDDVKRALSAWIFGSPKSFHSLDIERFAELVVVSCEKGFDIPFGKMDNIFSETIISDYLQILFPMKATYEVMQKRGYRR